MSGIADRAQRRQAALTAGHAFVWASAGTGKTHTLTVRALWWLLSAPFQPRAAGTAAGRLYTATDRAERLGAARAVARRFVLTTFTRKAAAEMLTRLYGYLDQLATAADFAALRAAVAESNGGHGDEQFVEIIERTLERVGEFDRLRAGAEALAELATELPIATLHSYAAAILRRHPIAAGIPPTARFVEEDETAPVNTTALLVERWWQHVVSEPELNNHLTRLVEWFPLGQLGEWLAALVEEPWIAAELEFDPPDPAELGVVLTALRAGLVAELQTVKANAKNIIAARDVLSAALQRVERGEPGAWAALGVALLSIESTLFSKPGVAAQKALGVAADIFRGSDIPVATEKQPAAGRDRNVAPTPGGALAFETLYTPVLRQCLATDWAERWGVWREFAGRFAAWADGAVVRELELVTFDEIVRRAARVLRDNADARREERERIGGLLVDEFQDTDPVQLELLRLLIGRASATDHEVLGFFVGDRKQSIYKFRKADLPALENFVAEYPALAKVEPAAVAEYRLTASFRSLPPLTMFVNKFFATAVPLPGYASERLEPVRATAGAAPTWWVLPALGKSTAEARRAQAAEATARLIAAHVQAGGSAAYRDIVALVNTHTELAALLPALEAAGIPAVSAGAKTFYQKPEVLDMLNLLIAAHNPLDALAVGALLRSPLVGLSDPQIYRLQRELPSATVFGGTAALPAWLPAAARARLEQLREWIAARARLAVGDWCGAARAVVPAGVYARQDQDGRALARIDSVLAAFQRVARAGVLPPLAWLLEQRARVNEADRHDADLGEDVSVTDESMDAARVMTIHKAKGLQGKFVILCGWEQTLAKLAEKTTRQAVYRLTSDSGEALTAFALPLGELKIISPQYSAAAAANARLDAAEAARLAYVATTRARDQLALLSHAAPANLEQFADTVTVMTEMPVAVAAPVAAAPPTVTDGAGYSAIWRARLTAFDQPASALLARPSQPESAAEDDASEAADYRAELVAAARDRALALGTLGHRYLEAHLTDEAFDPAKLAALATDVDEPILARARECLAAFWGSEQRRRARAARVLGREIPVFLGADGQAWNGVIDLALEEGGTVVGVDYKFMARPAVLPANYARQEKLYTVALRRLFPDREVRFEFWWVAQGG